MRTAIRNALARLAGPKRTATVRKMLGAVADYTGRADRDDTGRMRVHTRPPVVDDTWFRPVTGVSPTDMPVRWRMWDASGCPEIHENLTPTQTIPMVIEVDADAIVDAFAVQAAVSRLQSTRSPESVLAWLTDYVNRTPVYA